MSKREEMAELYGESLTFMDGFDDCILGVCERFGQETIVAYDYNKVLDSLVMDGMSLDEAEEWVEFNQKGAWVGEYTPCFITRTDD